MGSNLKVGDFVTVARANKNDRVVRLPDEGFYGDYFVGDYGFVTSNPNGGFCTVKFRNKDYDNGVLIEELELTDDYWARLNRERE